MSDAREALVALIPPPRAPEHVDHWPQDEQDYYRHGDFSDWAERLEVLDRMRREKVADAILAAGWTLPTVKPSVEQVVDALAAQRPGSAEWTSSRIMQTARAVLALLPGRSEAEVKAEALREAAIAVGTYDEGDVHLWARDADTWLLDRADRIEKEADDDR